MTMTAARIALAADFLANPDTDLTADPATWKHSDGRPATEHEAETVRNTTLAEIGHAMRIAHGAPEE